MLGIQEFHDDYVGIVDAIDDNNSKAASVFLDS
jgi:hypothetical protein